LKSSSTCQSAKEFVAAAELDFTAEVVRFQIAKSCGVAFNLLTMCSCINADLGANYPHMAPPR
jgi:hypothetical protein